MKKYNARFGTTCDRAPIMKTGLRFMKQGIGFVQTYAPVSTPVELLALDRRIAEASGWSLTEAEHYNARVERYKDPYDAYEDKMLHRLEIEKEGD